MQKRVTQKPVTFALAVTASLALSSPALADEGGWNPYSGKSQAPTSSRSAAPPTSGWKMPKLWPQTTTHAKAQPKRRSNQPSTWNRMTAGTQSMLSKTADALTPWDNQDASKKAPPKLTGSNSVFSQSTNSTKNDTTKSQNKDSAVSSASWWSPAKEEKPKTVTDFLARPRP